MTDLASELDQKLTRLAPAKALALERLVRQAMALADAPDASLPAGEVDAGSDNLLNLRVYPLPLTAQDFGRLCDALAEPGRQLPRLRELLLQPGKLGHA